MSAATASPPVIPPRPSRSQEKTSVPMVPPRPTNRRIQRSISPNPDRFAPSPLNEAAFLKSSNLQAGSRNGHSDPIPRSTSVDLPSLGEEGKEYDGLADELSSSAEGSTDPEQTRTVAHDLKLHAPKPSLPAASAKQRVMAVTRTDSERAASFGIGRPSSADNSIAVQPSNRSLKKKASTASQLSTTAESHNDDEHGIPEIGLQVPMYKNAGDVQAPSPAPSSAEGQKPKHHTRRTSARGNLPPGSYGLHGHGVAPQDKLEKAYYDKHPDLLKKEHVPHHYDRPNDFSMSSDDLNKIVKDTASRGSGLGAKNYSSTPSDQIGWQALDETASRITSPGNASPELKEGSIHVEEPNRRRSVMFSDSESVKTEEEVERPYTAPILAEDELAKDPSAYAHEPAVEPHGYDSEEPASRPASRPTSLYRETSYEVRSTPLEDVEEYEPLFKDDEKQKQEEKKKPAKEEKAKKHRFPSADIWEDAPSSVFYTAEVSTPELFDGRDQQDKPSPAVLAPPREGETPAQAFARQQEELAEKEARGQKTEGFVPAPDSKKPLWAQHQKHLAAEAAAGAARPAMHQRFPSRDVWEDAPDSLNLETTVSTPQQDEEEPAAAAAAPASPAESKPTIPGRPQAQATKPSPAIPERPRPRRSSGDEKPAVPERPKPAIPARPVKASPTSGGLEPGEAAAPPRQKPAVPVRPPGGVGSKIAALQAGFMSDLNRRLQLGPQAVQHKKAEPEGEEGVEGKKEEEEKEKVPLSDARKGRARGPARRAPAAASPAPAPAPAESAAAKPVFAFAVPVTLFEIDPDEGVLSAASSGGAAAGEDHRQPESKTEVEPQAADNAPAPATAAASAAETETETAQQDGEVGEKKKEAAPAQEQEEQTSTDKAEPAAASSEAGTHETKSLATNLAGETLIKEEVKKDEEHGDVEPMKVVEN